MKTSKSPSPRRRGDILAIFRLFIWIFTLIAEAIRKKKEKKADS